MRLEINGLHYLEVKFDFRNTSAGQNSPSSAYLIIYLIIMLTSLVASLMTLDN